MFRYSFKVTMAINAQTRNKIIAQALTEIIFARRYKQGKIRNWQKNESMYYGFKQSLDTSRANVELGKMQGFVNTILSKIDNPLVFKFVKGDEADLKPAKRLNALREKDANRDDWDIKDILGKKQAILYGRAIYCYHADNYNKIYTPCLENVDVYDFLVDPSGGGYDLEKAYYMGRYGVVKTRQELKEGRKAGIYLKTEVDLLLSGSSNNTEITNEVINESNRYLGLSDTQQRELQNNDKFKFWEWYTTFSEDGKRYYLLLEETSGRAPRVELLEDCLEADPQTGEVMFPFWSWAAYPDLTEFWTPSYCDYVREVFMAQSISINQMIDNAEQINKPQKAINVDRIQNIAEVRYKKDGFIKVSGETNVNNAVQILAVPPIDTPIKVYETLDTIQQVESGVNNGAKGIANEDKVGIYEGNQAAAADRFGLLNLSYSFGYKRFAKLYLAGTQLITKKIAIQLIGIDGIQVEEITKKDLKTYSPLNVTVQSSDAETSADFIDKKTKIEFLNNSIANPVVGQTLNPKAAFEMMAEIVGLNADDIKRLLDKDEYGNAELLSEAARDIKRILGGERIKPNEAANNAYKQKIVDYLRDNKEFMSNKQWGDMAAYLETIEPFIIPNMVSSLTKKLSQEGVLGGEQGLNPGLLGQPAESPVVEPVNPVETPVPQY